MFIVLVMYLPMGVDWQGTYTNISENPFHPFVDTSFTNPPWVIAFLPHAWLPVRIGNAINFMLNAGLILLLIHRMGGDWQTILMVFTSPVFFDLARTNNIEWIPILALLLPLRWGLPVILIKPHSIGGFALVRWKKQGYRITDLIPVVVVIGLSFVIWGLWFRDMGLPSDSAIWNFAPFPLLIPLGIYLLVRGIIEENEMLAVGATPFLTPYIAPYSITVLLAYIGSRHKRLAFIVYVAFWVYTVVETRRMAFYFE